MKSLQMVCALGPVIGMLVSEKSGRKKKQNRKRIFYLSLSLPSHAIDYQCINKLTGLCNLLCIQLNIIFLAFSSIFLVCVSNNEMALANTHYAWKNRPNENIMSPCIEQELVCSVKSKALNLCATDFRTIIQGLDGKSVAMQEKRLHKNILIWNFLQKMILLKENHHNIFHHVECRTIVSWEKKKFILMRSLYSMFELRIFHHKQIQLCVHSNDFSLIGRNHMECDLRIWIKKFFSHFRLLFFFSISFCWCVILAWI